MTLVLLAVVAVELVCVGVAWRTAQATKGGALGPMLVTAAFLFYGGADLAGSLLGLATSADTVAFAVSDEALHRWRLFAALGIIVLTLSYACAATVLRGGPMAPEPPPSPPPRLTRFSWKVLAFAIVPLWLAAVRGAAEAESQADYWRAGIANQFLLLLFVLAVIDFSLRHQDRPGFAFMALAVASAMTLLIGQRLEVFAIAILSLGALRWYGVRLPRRAVAGGAAFVLLLTMSLTVAREEVGRERLTGDVPVAARVDAIGDALADLGDVSNVREVAAEFVGRFDGNRFPALITDAQERTDWRPGLDWLRVATGLAVPSFVNPIKTSLPLEQRSEKEMLNQGYELRIIEDFLPTLFGSAVAQTGIDSLVVVLVVLGVLLAAVDRWLAGRRSDIRLVCGLGFAISIVYFERDLANWILVLRGVVPLVLLMGAVAMAQAVVARNRPSSVQPTPRLSAVAGARAQPLNDVPERRN